MLYNNPPYIKIIKRDRIWQQWGHGSIDIHRDVQHKYFRDLLSTVSKHNRNVPELPQLSSKQHRVRDDQILDLDCEWGGEEKRGGGKTVCSLVGHFQTSSIGAKWSFLITFIFLLKLQERSTKSCRALGWFTCFWKLQPRQSLPGTVAVVCWGN